ncbi:transglycosylase domain-containing protein [Microvirga massiliensis]|uniref:transglycosylase domain-containing protein n=1 Tax=Microvirga massiliensis TaxID=1033741 RepID=UPI00062BAA19|nr:PBP1A family penicillin-binding protein [Microvirga massiliensis]
MANGRGRQEPTFETRADAGRLDLSLSPEDRAGGGMARRGGSRGGKSKPSRRGRSGSRRRSLLGRLFYGLAVLGLWAVIAVAGIIAYHAAQLPPIDQLAVPKRPPNIAILAADGSLIGNRGETGGQTVSIKELPPYLPKAFVAIEDRRFYDHFGIDPLGITRAALRNVTNRGVSQGGSTLTQQLAKNLFLTQERTISRKIQEAILALWLERTYSKDEILELYLNRVYFGAGAYGIEAAAHRYYGKPAKAITLPEAAVLAGLVQAPSRLAPNRNPRAAQERAELVLAAMQELGFVTPSAMKNALAQPAQVRRGGSGSANYAADYVMDVLEDFVGTIDSDIVVSTTLDTAMQAAAEQAVSEELAAKGARYKVSQGALVAMQPDGALKALVGGRDYEASQFNRATAARRQPGSAFKPFVYLTAIERGLTPDTVRDDAPFNYRGWSPENFSRDYRGPVTLREALALSLNTVAARLGVEVGPKAVVQTAQRLGITSPLQANPSIALGTSEVTPLELVAAFAAFANGGTGVIPFVIQQVKTADGKVLYRRPRGGGLGRVIDPAAVAMMNDMLHQTFVVGTARKGEIPGWESAGKTGTSQEHRDAWFVGYTGALVAGVWLGNDSGEPTKRLSGGNLPVELWSTFMKAALKNKQPVPLPGAPRGEYETPVASGPQPGSATERGDRGPIARADRNFLERLFGLY